MSDLLKWIDLRGNDNSRLKVSSITGEDGRTRTFLYVVGLKSDSIRWKNAIDKLGFIASPATSAKRFLVRQVREGEKLRADVFHPVWPNATTVSLPKSEVILNIKPLRKLRDDSEPQTAEEREVAQETGVLVRLGRNAEGDEVFASPTGRYLQRDNGQKVYENNILGPASFLRAPDPQALSACCDGFARAMLLGEVQHSEDLDRFIQAVTGQEGPYDAQRYEQMAASIDAALVRYLNKTYDTAQDAYGDAARLYDYLPPYKGNAKGQAAMPLPLSVIAQRLLGDTKDRHVLVPNAWDGASFAFLSQGTRIHAFRGPKDLSSLVSDVRSEDVTWESVFDPARQQGADGLFFNADPLRSPDGTRADFHQALAALRTLNPGARAVFVVAGDNSLEPGVVQGASEKFLLALGRRCEIETAFELGAELTNRLGTGAPLRLISVRNVPAGPDSLRIEPGVKLPVIHDWDELKSLVDEVIATIKLREAESDGIDVERVAIANDFQRPYVAFSKVGEARTMVPKNLQGPLQYALSSLESVHGPVDAFVERELGFGPNTLGERFSPEQVDAIGLGIARMKNGRGIIIGDETGIGKGRTLGAIATWASKQDRDVVFVTDRANLFSDLVRDLRDIGEWGRFRPLVMNSDGVLVDVFTKEVLQKGTPAKVMNKVIEERLTLNQLSCNIIFATYSQLSGEDSPKAEWLLNQASNSLVIVDEAHVAAGSNSNISLVVSELVNRAWATAYSSATWAKTSDNLHIYSRAFPETINIASLTATMRTGGEAFSEVFSSMLARDGALVRREHDLSKIEFDFAVDTANRARNEALSDKVAEILASMTYVSGDIHKLLTKLNTDTIKELKAAREARSQAVFAQNQLRLAQQLAHGAAAEGQPALAGDGANQAQAAPETPVVQAPLKKGSLMRTSFGAGSVLYQVMRRFLCVLNADHVTELAMQAITKNQKPVIVFEDTAEAFLRQIIQEEEILFGVDGERISSDMARMPTIKDMLRGIMKRMAVVSVVNIDETQVDSAQDELEATTADAEEALDGEVDLQAVAEAQGMMARRSTRALRVLELPGLTPHEQESYEKGMKKIMEMIEALPPMPLNPVDVISARLKRQGLTVDEISGRSMRLDIPDDVPDLAITDPAWEHTRLKIVPRARKKSDVNATVFEFNAGNTDVLFINRSAATGLSLHSSPRFADVRRRVLIEMQIPADPTNRIQLFGRVNRYDQVCTPRIMIPTTGIYGEVRQLMMQNKKLARLSANIRSSRDNAAEITEVPDLLNKIGEDVCRQFLEENAGIRSRLGITYSQVEHSYDLSSKVTSRIALLTVAEQRTVYEELYSMFEDQLNRYELMGENPLKPREKDLRASTVASRLVVGIEMEGLGSAFDGPVFLKKIEWKEPKESFSWRQVVELVRDGRQAMLRSGLLVPGPEFGPTATYDEYLISRARGGLGSSITRQEYRNKKTEETLKKRSEGADVWIQNGLPVNSRGDMVVAATSGPDVLNSELLPRAAWLDAVVDEPVDEQLLTPLEVVVNDVPIRDSQESSQPKALGQIWRIDEQEAIAIERMELELPSVKFGETLDKLKRVMAAKVQIELSGTNFRTVEEALLDPGKNGVKEAFKRQKWIEDEAQKLVPGAEVAIPLEMLGVSVKDGSDVKTAWAIVVAVHAPAKGREALLSRWKVDVVIPGATSVNSLSLSALIHGQHSGVIVDADMMARGLRHKSDDANLYQTFASLWDRSYRADTFQREHFSSRQRHAYVMDGNLYLASEWAAATKLGSGVIYTDERGVRHRAIMLKSRSDYQADLIEHMPVRLWSRSMIEEFLRRLSNTEDERRPLPNGPGETYLIATSFAAATPAGLANSDIGTRVMIVPGKAVALVVDKGDVGRMSRAMRGYLNTLIRNTYPDYSSLPKEQREEIKKQFVQISVRTAKRKERPMITVSCERPEDFHHVSDLLSSAAGIEMYLGRRTLLGELAQEVQDNFFAQRLAVARQNIADQGPPAALEGQQPAALVHQISGSDVVATLDQADLSQTEVLEDEGQSAVIAQRNRPAA
jgi:hypothetical protein